MPSLLCLRAQTTSAAGAREFVRLHVGHSRLKLAACNNATPTNPPCRISLMIIKASTPAALPDSFESLSLFHEQDQVEAGIDIGWEGDIEVGDDQDLVAIFKLSTAADILYLTCGVEPLR